MFDLLQIIVCSCSSVFFVPILCVYVRACVCACFKLRIAIFIYDSSFDIIV